MISYLVNEHIVIIQLWQLKIISAHADGGPRSRVCARETLPQPPIEVSRNFPAPVSAESPSKIRDQSFPEEVSLKKDR